MPLVDNDTYEGVGILCLNTSFSSPLRQVHACHILAFDDDLVVTHADVGDVALILGPSLGGAVDPVVSQLLGEVVGDHSFEPRPRSLGALTSPRHEYHLDG